MKNGAVAALVLVALVVGGGVGYLASSITPITTTTTQTTAQGCTETLHYPVHNQTTLSNGTEISIDSYPVLMARPGSTIILCVNYGTVEGYNKTYSGAIHGSAYGWGADRNVSPTQNVILSPTPENISVSPGETADVEYRVEMSRNSTGHYGLNLFDCQLFPLAVGNESSRFKSSDFPELFRHRCPPQTLQGVLVGYGGAKEGYITTQGKYNPMIKVSGVSITAFPTPQGAENVTLKMKIRSFSQAFTVGLSLEASYTHEFKGNPALTTMFTNDLCNWSPRNDSGPLIIWSFQEGLSGFLKADAPELTIGAYSNATYSFSVLMNGRVANYTAIDLALYAKVPGSVRYVALWVTILSFFPVNISGYLQSISGSCSSTYGE
jgi:hypothetical protein